MSLDPSIVSQAVQRMQQQAEVCNAVMGGTLAMRAAGAKYLPQEPMEGDDAYASRLAKSTLFPAMKKAVGTMVGKPFGSPVTLGSEVPVELEACAENIDLAGRDLDTFARDVFQQTITDGIGWILVEFQDTQRIAAQIGRDSLTLADERELGVRPYWVHIPLSAVLGWRSDILNGKPRLVQFRYLETTEEPDGRFGTKTVQRVRVLEPGKVTVYVKTDKGEWLLDPENSGPVTMPEIPLVTCYTGRTGFMTAEPPLEDLAWLNVTHWQSQSDQRSILHKARVPVLFGKGLEEVNGKVVMGPNTLIKGGPDSDLKWVEIQGGSISAGRQDLLDLEDAMTKVAGEVVARVSGDKTATEVGHESREGSSLLKKWVWTFQDALEEALRLSAQWIGKASGGSLILDTDWDEEALGADMIQAMTNAEGRIMSRDTAIWNLQQRGFLPPDRTIEDEKALIDTEASSALAAFGPMPSPRRFAQPQEQAPTE